MAGQPGDCQGEGVHGERLQHRLDADLDRAAVHADPARNSLWGVGEPNPFDVSCLEPPGDASKTDGGICGGSIAFGGGVPLYRNKTRVGGLGGSGDTACADHEIAKRIRHLAGLDPEKGEFADDITYTATDGASAFSHPLCANTWRNGKKLGDESKAQGHRSAGRVAFAMHWHNGRRGNGANREVACRWSCLIRSAVEPPRAWMTRAE